MLRASRYSSLTSGLLSKRLRSTARYVATATGEHSEPILQTNYLQSSLLEDLKRKDHISKPHRSYAKAETMSLHKVTADSFKDVTEEDRKEVSWSSNYDLVTRSPFVTDIMHLQSLLDALLASRNFERAENIMNALAPLLDGPEKFIVFLNKYLEAYAAEESTSISDLEAYATQMFRTHRIQPNDRTHAIFLGKSLNSPQHFQKWLSSARKSRSLFRNMLNSIDAITVEGLTKIFKDPSVTPQDVPKDLMSLYNEVRDKKTDDIQSPTEHTDYFATKDAQIPTIEKEGMDELRSVDSFGLKVVRHALLGLESNAQLDIDQFTKELDEVLDSHLLHNSTGKKKNWFEFYKTLKSPADRERFNKMLDEFNEGRQKNLEVKGTEGARAKWANDFKTFQQRGEIIKSKRMNVQLYRWYSDVLPLVQEEHSLCQKLLSGEIDLSLLNDKEKKAMSAREFYAPYFVLLPPETLSVLVIFELLKLNDSGGIAGGMRAARAVISVGRAVELEYRCQSLIKADKKVAQRKGLTPMQWRRLTKSREQASSSSVVTDWTNTIYSKLGGILTQFLLHVAKVEVTGTNPTTGVQIKGLQPAFHHTFQYTAGQKIGVINLHKNVIKMLGGDQESNLVHPSLLPMLVSPRPWTSHNQGGYSYTPSNIVRIKDSAETTAYVKAAADAENLEEIYSGLNILGETAWTVNQKLLNIVSKCWNTGEEFLDIPPAIEDVPIPPPPNYGADPAERVEYANRVRAIANKAASERSQRCDINYKLEIARAFVGERMFFPHNVDFRGRAYPISPNFNHLGNDMTRSLFLFWDGHELGEQGLRWLKIQLANVFGKDKATLEDRVRFVDENMENIFESAKDPLGEGKWWMKGEKPWQVLSVCFELQEAYQLDDPTKFVSHIPVHQDGTCNGLQHYAALGGDIEGAAQVNLVPADKPQDVYQHVAGLVEKRLATEAEAGDKRAIFLQGKIRRKVVKQTVMTNVYGVTYVGAVAQIEKQIGSLFDTGDRDAISTHARYLTTLVFASIRELFEGAHCIQDWLGEAAKRISKSMRPDFLQVDESGGSRPSYLSSVIWTSPLGLPCVQPYRTLKTKTIRTSLQDVSVSDPFGASQVDSRKQQAAFPPNFVHSLDATHMLMTAKACGQDNLTFASVHDSYWTHARHVDDMNKHIREQFVKLHEDDLIQKLKEEFERRYEGFLQVLCIPIDHELTAEIKEVRKNIVKQLGRALTVADEVLIEQERLQLLRSDKPSDVAKGKAMKTTISVTEGYDVNDIAVTRSVGAFQILAPLVFPQVPKRGSLDVKVVKDLKYFFS